MSSDGKRPVPFAPDPLFSEQIVDLAAQDVKIVHSEINDRVTDIGDQVKPFQSLNYQIPDHSGGNFIFPFHLQALFDGVDQLADFFRRDRPFGAGDADAVSQFFGVEDFPLPVRFHDHGRTQKRPFISVEALFTGGAETPPLELPILRFSRVNYICFRISAKRTVHTASYLVRSTIKKPPWG